MANVQISPNFLCNYNDDMHKADDIDDDGGGGDDKEKDDVHFDEEKEEDDDDVGECPGSRLCQISSAMCSKLMILMTIVQVMMMMTNLMKKKVMMMMVSRVQIVSNFLCNVLKADCSTVSSAIKWPNSNIERDPCRNVFLEYFHKELLTDEQQCQKKYPIVSLNNLGPILIL